MIASCPALVDVDTFERAKQRAERNRHAPAAAKAKVEYLLSGKLYCGMCGGSMVGGYGTSHTGAQYAYYVCRERKLNHTCAKRNEKKDFLEWYVVSQTVEYVLTPPRIDLIAESIVAEYEQQFGAKQVRELESRIARLEADERRLVESLLDAPKTAHKSIYAKMEEIGLMREDAEVDLIKQRTASGIQYKPDEIKAWLRQFCAGDTLDMEFRRRIIEVFINSVYLYDDKVIIFYNIKGGKQVSYIDMLDATDEVNQELIDDGCKGSDIDGCAPQFQEPRQCLGF
ncbi:hypothetical protein AGMMS49992_33070 [Clostridia bacterium]|nr:hypothetical protein AGMMS49992_33070 [Clostridia bacterium]